MPRRSLTFVCSKIFATYELQISIVLHFSRSTNTDKRMQQRTTETAAATLKLHFMRQQQHAARGKAELIATRLKRGKSRVQHGQVDISKLLTSQQDGLSHSPPLPLNHPLPLSYSCACVANCGTCVQRAAFAARAQSAFSHSKL